jgi:hypothetical protein
MRPLAYFILAILGVLCFGILWFTRSSLCVFGSLFLLYSVWSLICAACPQFRGPNVKCPAGVSARVCVTSAVYTGFIGAILFAAGMKFGV